VLYQVLSCVRNICSAETIIERLFSIMNIVVPSIRSTLSPILVEATVLLHSYMRTVDGPSTKRRAREVVDVDKEEEDAYKFDVDRVFRLILFRHVDNMADANHAKDKLAKLRNGKLDFECCAPRHDTPLAKSKHTLGGAELVVCKECLDPFVATCLNLGHINSESNVSDRIVVCHTCSNKTVAEPVLDYQGNGK
jgi:hypothetical protein